MTREGVYRLMTLADYSRPSRVGYANQQGTGSTPVKVSFVGCGSGENEKIAFNYGRELFVYPYRGVRRGQETKVIDKRVYKGTSPTCHDFGPPGCLRCESQEVIPLLVGFTGGQVHLIDPVHKELSRLYNEERMIDKTKVTCIKWAPGRADMFVASHASGHLYTYLADTECPTLPPQYTVTKQGEGYTFSTCKTRPQKNPVSKCLLHGTSITEFSFSPCGQFIATVSQDGFLRIFVFDSMELIGTARSYFGGLLCCSWSPDGRYIVVGGEDDLVHVYSVQDKRVVARGKGHRSWVSQVMFDVYNLAYGDVPDGLDFSGSDDETGSAAPPTTATSSVNSPPPSHRSVLVPDTGGGARVTRGAKVRPLTADGGGTSETETASTSGVVAAAAGTELRITESDDSQQSGSQQQQLASPQLQQQLLLKRNRKSSCRDSAVEEQNVTCYRFGSVGQDTMICLWDLTEDILKLSQAQAQSKAKGKEEAVSLTSKDSGLVPDSGNCSSGNSSSGSDKAPSTSSLSYKLATLNFGSSSTKESSGHKRAFSLPGRGEKKDAGKEQGGRGGSAQDNRLTDTLGSPGCPRLNETPVMDPIVIKKIAHERLTALLFREECIVTACMDGYVCTWARPGHVGNGNQPHSSPIPIACAADWENGNTPSRTSPPINTTNNGTGTVV